MTNNLLYAYLLAQSKAFSHKATGERLWRWWQRSCAISTCAGTTGCVSACARAAGLPVPRLLAAGRGREGALRRAAQCACLIDALTKYALCDRANPVLPSRGKQSSYRHWCLRSKRPTLFLSDWRRFLRCVRAVVALCLCVIYFT